MANKMQPVYNGFTQLFSQPMTGVGLIFLIVLGVEMVVMFWAWCRLFWKMGLPWERMFVPGYNYFWTYASVESAGLFVFKVTADVLSLFAVYYIGERWPVIVLLGCLIPGQFVIRWFYSLRLAQAFGRGKWFAAGLFFLRPVFLCMLAFGPAHFYGDLGAPTGEILPASSWVCPVCHTVNPQHRDVCENCGRRTGIS